MNNRTNGSGETSVRILERHKLWYWILTLIISLLSVMGNITVIFIIGSTPRLRTKQNAFILSLAVADFCIGLFITPTLFLCSTIVHCEMQLQVVFYNFLLVASMANLIVMTLDRYIAVIYPMKYKILVTKRSAVVLIAMAWIFAFFSSFIQLAWLYESKEILITRDRLYRVIINIVLGLLPCLIMLFAFARIFLAIRGQIMRQRSQRLQVAYNHSTTSIATQPKLSSHKNQNLASVRVLGGVVLLFVFCYSLNIVYSFCGDFHLCERTPLFYEVSMIFVYVNSFVNFMVNHFSKRSFERYSCLAYSPVFLLITHYEPLGELSVIFAGTFIFVGESSSFFKKTPRYLFMSTL